MSSSRKLSLGRILLLRTIVAVAVLAQGCTQILDDDLLAGGSDIGGGIITPVVPVAPTGPMAANVRIVSDPQGGSYVSEIAGGGSNPIVITVNWVTPCGTHKSEMFVFDGGTQTYESSYPENGRTIVLDLLDHDLMDGCARPASDSERYGSVFVK